MQYFGKLRSVAEGRGVWEPIEKAAGEYADEVARIPIYLSDRSSRRLGHCQYKKPVGRHTLHRGPVKTLVVKRIVLASRHWHRELKLSTNTLLHEASHAIKTLLYGKGKGGYHGSHGTLWRKVAREVGIKPDRCSESPEMRVLAQSRQKVVGICIKCSHQIRRQRALPRGRTFTHNACGGGQIVAQR